MRIIINLPVMWTVFRQADMKLSRVSLRRIRAMAKAPATPTAPPSVGLKTPMRIPPRIRMNRKNMPMTPLRDWSFSLKGTASPRGGQTRAGPMPISHRQRIKDRASSRPGTIPAIKSLPTDSSVTMA